MDSEKVLSRMPSEYACDQVLFRLTSQIHIFSHVRERQGMFLNNVLNKDCSSQFASSQFQIAGVCVGVRG